MLEKFARSHNLYLDKKGQRPCRSGKKCTWIDKNNNSHDLDFVLERGGTPDTVGMPAAFIETAWRRYTKHSRNKAQEIQGAVEPLAETYRHAAPFKGAILAGVFTDGALGQLRSLGFTVLYFPYEGVVKVFDQFGIDARSEENTPIVAFDHKVAAYEALSMEIRKKLAAALVKAYRKDVQAFVKSLSEAVLRQIEHIVVLALHGTSREVSTVDEAIDFIKSYIHGGSTLPVERYEVEIRYNNGNRVTGSFQDKASAIEFLMTYQPVSPQVV